MGRAMETVLHERIRELEQSIEEIDEICASDSGETYEVIEIRKIIRRALEENAKLRAEVENINNG